MPPTVEDICKQLVRRRLHSVTAVQALYQRWRKQGKDVHDVRQFGRWLIAEKLLTKEQAGQLFQAAPAAVGAVSAPAKPAESPITATAIPEINVELVKEVSRRR